MFKNMLKASTIFLAFVIFIGLFQTASFAYTVDEETVTSVEEDGESPFTPKLPLADLVKPLDVLTAPSALETEEVVFPDHGEIIIKQQQNSYLNTDLPPPSAL